MFCLFEFFKASSKPKTSFSLRKIRHLFWYIAIGKNYTRLQNSSPRSVLSFFSATGVTKNASSTSIADGISDMASGTVLNLANGLSKISYSSGVSNVILIRIHCDT